MQEAIENVNDNIDSAIDDKDLVYIEGKRYKRSVNPLTGEEVLVEVKDDTKTMITEYNYVEKDDSHVNQ